MTERKASFEPAAGGNSVQWDLGPGDVGEWIMLHGQRWAVQCSGEGVCLIQGANTGGVPGGSVLDEQGLELRLGPNRIGTIGTPTRFVRPVRDDSGDETITISLMMRNT